MQKARVIITPTLICSRNCSYCCNRYESLITPAKRIHGLAQIPHRDELIITGGEPMEHVKWTQAVIEAAHVLGFKRIYLYTARWHDALAHIINRIDGINYTLHENSTKKDIAGFHMVQLLSVQHPDKSFRAFIHPELDGPVPILPWVWKRLEIKPWIPEGKCPLPDGEELFIMERN